MRCVRASRPSHPNFGAIFMESWLLGQILSPHSPGKAHLFSSPSRLQRRKETAFPIRHLSRRPNTSFSVLSSLKGTDSYKILKVTTASLTHNIRQHWASSARCYWGLQNDKPTRKWGIKTPTEIHMNTKACCVCVCARVYMHVRSYECIHMHFCKIA